ncbi:YeeE/YedE [Herbaspirillum hiltneri N3]|uniref:YeeE/YedE n=1 Tax=Herbaspirillum hiltneri N3 TaxID=1262470 RepID=A0ABN4HXD3_9BURK|nr:YeeE/YedE thiosulfate transporter family protein [Herbaspirillum hiltneri]AKZ63463.1 YeeE/YedE [Herbaspirillum hiltneri N3]
MMIEWTNMVIWRSLAGGALIGLAAAMLILFNGRIAGISGILGGLIGRANKGEKLWRGMFLAGLLLAAPLWRLMGALPDATITATTPLLIVGGVLVGVGTRYAGGCTSGHGVCGISRGSVRSFVATAAFMMAGFIVTYLARHVFFFPGS